MSDFVESGSQDGPNPDIPEKDQQTIKDTMKLFQSWKKAKSKYDRNFMSFYKFFRGAQWTSKRPSFWHSEVVNMIWTTIQSNVPLQTDVRPRFSFLPQNPSDKEFAEVLEKLAESDWEKHNWLREVTEVLYDSYIYGTGFSSQTFDEKLDFGLGSVVYKSEDPFYCYPDPECNDINDPDSIGFFVAKPIETKRLKQMYPKSAEFIKADIMDFVKSSKTDLNDFKLRTFTTDRDMPEIAEKMFSGASTDNEKTLLITGYLKPSDLEETKDEDEEGNEIYQLRKKFPKGRMVVIASGALLVDEELPYEDGKIPFAKLNNYILPREFWGVSEVEQLASPQQVFNKILSFTLDIVNLMGNPAWIVDTSAGVDTNNFVNAPGMIIEKNAGSEVRREQGLGINPSYMNMLSQMEVWFNNVSGSQDVSKGQTPGSVTAASAIEQLMDASRTRIKQKMRNLDGYLREVGEQWLARVMQFYRMPKIFRIVGKDETMKFFQISIEDRGPQKVGVVTEFVTNEKGEEVPSRPKEFVMEASFDVRVNTGSTLPFSVAEKENKAFALFDRQIIDAEEVLNILDYPDKDKIMARQAERQEAEAAAAAQQGAQ